MSVVTMKCKGGRDCAVAAIGTACQATYDEAARALNHIDLPGMLESPILSNPWNLYRALIRLGFWKKNLTFTDIKNGNAKPCETIILVQESFKAQHWVLWAGTYQTHERNTIHIVYWGDSTTPKYLFEKELEDMIFASIPHCMFQVYKASFWELMWGRVQSWFRK